MRQLVRNRRAVHPLGAARQHRLDQGIQRALALHRLKRSVIEVRQHRHRFAAGLLGEKRRLHAVDLGHFRAGVNVCLRHVKGFGDSPFLLEGRVLQDVRELRRRHVRRALRLFVRNEDAHRAVVAHKVRLCRLVHVRWRHLRRGVAIPEIEAPVAQGNVVRELHRKFFGVAQGALKIRGGFSEGKLHLRRIRRRLLESVFDRVDQHLLHLLHVVALFHHGAEHHKARILRGHRPPKDLAREPRFHKRLVEASARSAGQNIHSGLDGVVVRGQSRRNAIAHGHELAFARTPDFKVARTVRHRLHRPFGRERARRARNLPERLGDPREHLRFVELSGDRQNGVVGLIPLLVERLDVLDGHVFDVAAGADRVAAVGVPVKEDALHALEHHAHGLVFAHLVFVSHHRHFGVEILFGDVGIHHRVGAPPEGPAHVVVVGGEAHEVIRAVHPRRPVHPETPAREFARGIGIVLASLEHQVFQEMSHARLAVILHSRAHEIGGVHGGGGLALVGKKNDLQAVRELIALDAFHGVLKLRQRGRFGGHGRAGGCRHDEFLQSFFEHGVS